MQEYLHHYKDFLQKASDFSSFFEQERIQRVFQKFDKNISKYIGLTIGVSGGVDSMSMICLLLTRFQKNNYDFQHIHIVHCNHKIRKQSEKEADYLKTFFQGLPFFYFERDSEKKENTSLKCDENSLRKRRYQCFYKVCEHEHAPILLTGHHLEDRIETSFLNCIRGASLKGFMNMKTFQSYGVMESDLKFFRPLIDETKDNLYHFCQTFKILFFEDQTNQDTHISKRNWIRNEILKPLIAKGDQSNHFLQSMRNIYQSLEKLLPQKTFCLTPIRTLKGRNEKIALKLNENTKNMTKSDILALWEQLGIYYNITPGKLEDRFQWFQLQKGCKNLKDFYFFFAEQRLFIFQTDYKFREKRDSSPIITSVQKGEIYFSEFGFPLDLNDEKFLGATIRFGLPSDKIHGKTWNRRCINQKIPLFRRNRIPLAIKDGKIIYIWKNIIH